MILLLFLKKEIIVGIWTHTNNIVKVDCKNKIDDFSEYFGKEIVYMVHSENYRNKKTWKIDWDRYDLAKKKEFESHKKLWDEYKVHPELFLPMGSEGSLHLKSRLLTRVKNSLYPYRYKVEIYGDLRDHYDVEEVIDCIRNGVNKLKARHDCCISTEANVRNYLDGMASYKFEDAYFRNKDFYKIREPYKGS